MRRSTATILVLTALLAVGYAEKQGEYRLIPAPKGPIEDLINGTIESIRPLIPDPLEVSSLNIAFPDDYAELINGYFNIAGFSLSGVSGFQLQKLAFNILFFTVDFTLVVPDIHLQTQYDANLTVLNQIPLFGQGNADIDIQGTTIVASFKISLSPLGISNLKASMTLDDFKADVTGLLDDDAASSAISQWLTDHIANFINDNQQELADLVDPIIEDLINTIIKGIVGGDN